MCSLILCCDECSRYGRLWMKFSTTPLKEEIRVRGIDFRKEKNHVYPDAKM